MGSQPKIYVAGHHGMVGSAIVRTLQQRGQTNIVMRTHRELDLCDQAAVQAFFEAEKPTQVYLAAAKVGGIHANNTYPADFTWLRRVLRDLPAAKSADAVEALLPWNLRVTDLVGKPAH